MNEKQELPLIEEKNRMVEIGRNRETTKKENETMEKMNINMVENEKSGTVEYNDFNGNNVKLSPSIIRKYLVKGKPDGTPNPVSDQEVMLFLMLCKSRGLNPFTGEAHLVKYAPSSPATMVVGKDAFTARAAGHPDYNGMKAGIVVSSDGGEVIHREGSMKLPSEKLIGGWAEVFRKSWDHPVKSEVAYEEYEGKDKYGKANYTWAKMGATMIRKVALVQALREAFPDQFGGLYDSAEMSQATNAIDLSKEVETPVQRPEEKNGRFDVEEEEITEGEGGFQSKPGLITEKQYETLMAMLAGMKGLTTAMLDHYKVLSIEQLTVKQASEAIQKIISMKDKKKAASE